MFQIDTAYASPRALEASNDPVPQAIGGVGVLIAGRLCVVVDDGAIGSGSLYNQPVGLLHY